MAKFIPGPLVADIRRKLGGQVFSRNQFGAYTRTLVQPDQTPTAYRNLVQLIWAQANATWLNDITPEQRTAWQSYAALWNCKDQFGRKRAQSGRSTFISQYVYLSLLALSPNADAPALREVTPIVGLELLGDLSTESMTIDIAFDLAQPQPCVLLWATDLLNVTRNNPRGMMRLIAALQDDVIYPYNFYSDWVAKFGAPTAGKRIFVGATPIDADTGAAAIRLHGAIDLEGEPDAMLTLKRVLTNAEILALPTTPIQLLAAQGPGKRIVVLQAQLRSSITGNVTNIGSNASLYINSNPLAAIANDDGGQTTLNSFLANAGAITDTPAPQTALWSANQGGPTAQTQSAGGTDTYTNAPLTIAAFNGDAAWADLGNFTGGNAANFITIFIAYYVADLS